MENHGISTLFVEAPDESRRGETRFLILEDINEINEWYKRNKNKKFFLNKKIDF